MLLQGSKYSTSQAQFLNPVFPIQQRAIPLQREAGGVISGEETALKRLFDLYDALMHADNGLESKTLPYLGEGDVICPDRQESRAQLYWE